MGENLNPLRADLFLNNNLVIALNEISREIVGYLFDQNGKLISALGSTKNDAAIYDVENLFGFDLNKDNFKGDPNSNITKVDELQELKALGFNTFENTYNSANLYRDLVNGGIYVSSINDPSNKIQLLDETGNNFGINYTPRYGYKGIAVELITENSPLTVDPEFFELFPQYLGSYLLLRARILKICFKVFYLIK